MTYREKLKEVHPEKINAEAIGGCVGCPGDSFDGAPKIGERGCIWPSASRCSECWNREMPDTKPKTDVDIHKLIDDAMEKKDREVTIFISKDHTHITVSPRENTKPVWIEEESITGSFSRSRYRCSECRGFNDYPSPFCPVCGEKLAMPSKKEATDE